MPIRYIDEIEIRGKRVFIRVDFNVPLEEGRVSDDTRIRRAAETIRYAVDSGAKVILASHLGRPKGRRRPEFSLRPVVSVVSEAIGRPVAFAEDCVGEAAVKAVEALGPGDALLLENLRFHEGETANDPEFAENLASLCDVFCMDAFGTAHRAHASTEGITRFVETVVAGFLMKSEVRYITKALKDPDRPFVCIFGGAKVSTKIGAIRNVADKVDKVIVGGAMANTFVHAKGLPVGASRCEKEMSGEARRTMDLAGEKLLLPVDFLVADKFDPAAETEVVPEDGIPEGSMAVDIGPASIRLFEKVCSEARTIVWNGPMGAFEIEPFSKGTMAMAGALASSKAVTVVGGGESVEALNASGNADRVTYISTGGGAFLEMLEGRELPGVKALDR